MATQAQIDANRLNAQKSTGPRTPEGKAKSRRNAVKLGLSASAVMISGEDSREMAEIGQDYYRLCPPVNAVQRFHFENVVYCDWMIRRCRRIEAELMNHLMAKDRSVPWEVEAGVAFLRDAAGANALYKLHRRMASLEKSYYRSLRELEASGARLDAEPSDPETSDPEPNPGPCPESDEESRSRPGSAPGPQALPITGAAPSPTLEDAAASDAAGSAAPSPTPAAEIGFVLQNPENPNPESATSTLNTAPRRPSAQRRPRSIRQ
jgi:hypothetical protein